MRDIRATNVDYNYKDINWNFIVGEAGIFEGRGWHVQCEHSVNIRILICGDSFDRHHLTEQVFNEEAIRLGKIRPT